MAAHNELGKRGEDAACQYIENIGCKVIERNWRYEKHEIDIIAEDEQYIIFVEVKTRASDQWGNPEDFISNSQIKRIVTAADFYIQEKDIDKEPRFDVISIINHRGTFEIEHINDAFLPSLNQ